MKSLEAKPISNLPGVFARLEIGRPSTSGRLSQDCPVATQRLSRLGEALTQEHVEVCIDCHGRVLQLAALSLSRGDDGGRIVYGALGVGGTLSDPNLEFFAGSTKIGENNDWGGTTALSNAFAAGGAFPYAAPTSKDAAIFNPAIAPGGYSVRVTGNSGTTGTVIAELYDSTPTHAFTTTTPRLVNVSVLKQIDSGFTVGFVIGGATPRTVLVRAVGPGLAAVGVASGFAADPRLVLFAGSTKINESDDWGGTSALTAAMTQVGAFAIPATSKDAALLATLQPGSYSVRVSSPTGTAGLVIAEVYEVP